MKKTRSYLIASLLFLLSFNWASAQCLIEDVTVSAHSCDGDWFMINIDFSNVAVSDSVTVAGNGNQYGTFSSTNLPITLGPFLADNTTIYEFVVTDYQNICSDFGVVGPIDCSASNCTITDLIAEAHPCNGDNEFLVDIDFNHQNMPSDSFRVVGNGTHYGTFAYSDLWITIGPIVGDGSTAFEFIIIDQNNPNCTEETGLDPINCGGNCEIGELEISDIDCNNNGTYNFNLNFGFANINNDFFDVFVNGDFFGYYAFAALPLTIENFPMSGNPNDVLTVCQNDLPSCCATAEFESPNCNTTDCQITDLIVEAHPCDGGQFLVDINFDYQNMPSDSFHLVGNGMNYGTFAYADLWLTFGPIVGDGNTEFEFIVIDSENNDCTAFTGLDPIDCDGDDCEIWDMEVWDFECNDDGTYNLNLNFNYANVNNDFFDVFANGEFFGYYAFADLPVHIENFPASGNDFDAIKVCQNDLPTCCETLEFEAPNCGNSDCYGFEDLVLNTVYTTPTYQNDDIIFTTGDIPVKFQEFYQQGSTNIGSIYVADNNLPFNLFPNFEDNFLRIDFSNLEFNFLQLGQAVVHVEFDYYSPGLWINLSANDAPTSEAASFLDLDGTEIAPGVTMTVIPDANDTSAGKVVINGFMGLLTIGGDNGLSIDNLCLEYASIGDCWAGDTNSDFIANNFDLLNIGLAYGTEGTPRNDASIAWVAQPSDDWTQTFEDGTNYKHADANGDGIINAQDKFAIDENFGLAHGTVIPYVSPTPSSDDPPLFIVMPNSNDIGLGAFEAEIHLGENITAIDAIYGLAFTVEFNDQIFNASSMEVAFESGWFNNNGTDDLLSVQKVEDGKLATAVSRINQMNIGGGGKIGTISGIIDDLSGYHEIDLDIIDVKGITTNETLAPFNTPENYVEIETGIIENKIDRNLSIYPNPANELIFIKNGNKASIENIRLLNILGQEVFEKSVNENEIIELNVNTIVEGIYFLEIQLDGFMVTRKIEISHL